MRLYHDGQAIGFVGTETSCFHADCETKTREGYNMQGETQWEFHIHHPAILSGRFICNGCERKFVGATTEIPKPTNTEAIHFL